jgi:hypothetical protein
MSRAAALTYAVQSASDEGADRKILLTCSICVGYKVDDLVTDVVSEDVIVLNRQ